jgi:hypothetical protein
LARNSDPKLGKSGKNRSLCLILDFIGNAFSSSPLSFSGLALF